MNRLNWQTRQTLSVGPYEIPCAVNLYDQANHSAGIRWDSNSRRILKTIFWPLASFRDGLCGTGFIERTIGRWLKQIITDKTVFLDIGCGNMRLRKYLPAHICYNALDLSFSQFHLLRCLRHGSKINVALASATDIPLRSHSVNLIASTETFEHIPDIDRALDEIHRVAQPRAVLLCSIPNNFCHKYKIKGPHPEHVNSWSYDQFIAYMESRRFKFRRGLCRGYWVPLPAWLTSLNFQLPISPKKEFYCTNFFYQFEVEK